jgi:hypothetical protein
MPGTIAVYYNIGKTLRPKKFVVDMENRLDRGLLQP